MYLGDGLLRRPRPASVPPRLDPASTLRPESPGDEDHAHGLPRVPRPLRIAPAILVGLALAVASTPGRADRPTTRPSRPGPPEQRQHWSFVPPTRPEPPAVADRGWVRNPIDAFILRPIEEAGLAPAPEADRATLIRRLRFDLTGLPPSPEEVDAFVADPAPDAYERLVDRLLASPQYGERWARHWLDLARFAESDGFKSDKARPNAWRYRDWVVKALNDDMPYDRFVALQLAGDEIAPGRPRRLHRHRVQPELAVRGQQHGPRPEPAADARRHDRHHGLGRPRPDRRLRPVPRPQVRPDQPEGLLPDPGPLLRQPGQGRLRRRPARGPGRPRLGRGRARGPGRPAPPRDRGDREAVRRRAPQGQARQAPRRGPRAPSRPTR